MKPMLAHRFADHKDKVTYPVFIQPKLNGVRALYKGGQWQSRDEKLWNPQVLRHLGEELAVVLDSHMLLDGELYIHGWPLQKINGAIQVNRLEANTLTTQVEYHVFDIVDTSRPELPFEERAFLLAKLQERLLLTNATKVKTVTTLHATQAQAELCYALWRSEGYEGSMYRDPVAPYGFAQNCGNKENRWKHLLKRKDWLDDEFEVVGFNTTEGEKGNQGFQLRCRTKSGKLFSVGSGLSAFEVAVFEQTPPIGKLARIRYEMLSEDGIPLKPTIEMIFE